MAKLHSHPWVQYRDEHYDPAEPARRVPFTN
jgi:hypothetical protein